MQGRAYTARFLFRICVHTYARTHTRAVDDGSYKRAVERLPKGRATAGGLWQSTQGLEAKRLIPQEALHPVLIRREFYERFERYCACMRQHLCMRAIRANTSSCASARYWSGAKEIWNKARFVARDDGRMTGKRAVTMIGLVPGWNPSTGTRRRIRNGVAGKIVDFIPPDFRSSNSVPSFLKDDHQRQSSIVQYVIFLVDEYSYADA